MSGDDDSYVPHCDSCDELGYWPLCCAQHQARRCRRCLRMYPCEAGMRPAGDHPSIASVTPGDAVAFRTDDPALRSYGVIGRVATVHRSRFAGDHVIVMWTDGFGVPRAQVFMCRSLMVVT